MNTNKGNTKAASSTRSAVIRRSSKRVSKAALLRVKLAAIVAAVVLFLASLTGVAVYNPGVGNRVAAQAPQPAQITVVQPDGSKSSLLAPPPRVAALRPLVRSRGS